METTETYPDIKCLCDAPQRVQILSLLDDNWMEVRDIMEAIGSPRSTVQRNISILEDQGWVERTTSGYITTTVGACLCEAFVSMSQTTNIIDRMAPFLQAVDDPTEIDLRRLNEVTMTIPEPNRPNSPMNRLFLIFGKATYVRGLLPVVSCLSVKLSRNLDEGAVPECEYILSSDGISTLREQFAPESTEETKLDPPDYIDILSYEDELPYGLFLSDDTLVLTAYNELGRIQAIAESNNEETLNWGEQVYESYRQQSRQIDETQVTTRANDSIEAK